MARKYRRNRTTGHTVLVVDDNPDFLESARRLLEAEGHHVFAAADGPDALDVLRRETVDLVLLDYFMPGMTGADVVHEVRRDDRLVRIILVTGYAGEKPARSMMRQLDIQGYHDKSEGAERLLLWVDAALNTYRYANAIELQRRRLRYVLDATPELYRVQSLDDLLQNLLQQIEALLDVEHGFLATYPGDVPDAVSAANEGFVVLAESAGARVSGLEIRYGTGRYHPGTPLDNLSEHERSVVWQALQEGRAQVLDGHSVIPLRLGSRTIGVIYLDCPQQGDFDAEMLEVFANQAASAIHNALLYELATTDSLTGVHLRAFVLQRLHQSLKAAQRRGEPVSLLMIDLDRFKQVNDRFGHHGGDRVLVAVAELLRQAVRDTDVVGRYGGDEFLVVLPDTPPEGARTVAQRILEQAHAHRLQHEGEPVALELSVGVGTFDTALGDSATALQAEHFQQAAAQLIARADTALYACKHTGAPGLAPVLSWPDLPGSPIPAEPPQR
jgi:two-component system, cell cycle response regulator